MAKKKPETSLLDIFILLLVRSGIKTLYRLKQEAGVSIGAASPSLRRLEKRTFIYLPRKGHRGKEIVGKRGQREYQVNLFGQDFLQSDWLAPFEASLPTDTESVARLVAIAEAKHRPDVAMKTLRNAIGVRRKRARRMASLAGASSIAARYRAILQACDTARLKAEAAALKKVLANLK